MTLTDKRRFIRRRFSVLIRNSKPYGICQKCCTAAADRERAVCSGIVIEGDGVELLEMKPLDAVFMRCYVCLVILTRAEKILRQQQRTPFIKVGNVWRNYCFECMC